MSTIVQFTGYWFEEFAFLFYFVRANKIKIKELQQQQQQKKNVRKCKWMNEIEWISIKLTTFVQFLNCITIAIAIENEIEIEFLIVEAIILKKNTGPEDHLSTINKKKYITISTNHFHLKVPLNGGLKQQLPKRKKLKKIGFNNSTFCFVFLYTLDYIHTFEQLNKQLYNFLYAGLYSYIWTVEQTIVRSIDRSYVLIIKLTINDN